MDNDVQKDADTEREQIRYTVENDLVVLEQRDPMHCVLGIQGFYSQE